MGYQVARALDATFSLVIVRKLPLSDNPEAGFGALAEDGSRVILERVAYGIAKGALYFHTLRETLGDEAFFDVLRTYYRRHRYGIATPKSFLAVVESVTGDAHRDLFVEWVVGEKTE